MMKFSKGTYDVGVDASVSTTGRHEGFPTVRMRFADVTGNTANQFVTLGFDSDNDGVADVDEPDNERYGAEPGRSC